MSGWPKKFYRKTKHAKPRHQLFQPGFNGANGCWLDGGWITLPKEEWDRRKTAHDKMYRAAAKEMGGQHHLDPGTKAEDMTPAQKQAWEFYAGSKILDGVHEESGHVGPVDVDFAANTVHPKCAKWLREEGWKIMRFVKNPQGETTHQIEGLDIPEDLISAEKGCTAEEVVDTWQHVVDQNVANFDALFEDAVRVLEGTAEVPCSLQYAAIMAFGRLIQVEEGIVRIEWRESRGETDPYQTVEGEKERYVRLRKRLQGALDEKSFDAGYEQHRSTHNECARANLDNSDGIFGGFVLPKFNEDGSHEPWGDRDVPWNAPKEEAVA